MRSKERVIETKILVYNKSRRGIENKSHLPNFKKTAPTQEFSSSAGAELGPGFIKGLKYKTKR